MSWVTSPVEDHRGQRNQSHHGEEASLVFEKLEVNGHSHSIRGKVTFAKLRAAAVPTCSSGTDSSFSHGRLAVDNLLLSCMPLVHEQKELRMAHMTVGSIQLVGVFEN